MVQLQVRVLLVHTLFDRSIRFFFACGAPNIIRFAGGVANEDTVSMIIILSIRWICRRCVANKVTTTRVHNHTQHSVDSLEVRYALYDMVNTCIILIRFIRWRCRAVRIRRYGEHVYYTQHSVRWRCGEHNHTYHLIESLEVRYYSTHKKSTNYTVNTVFL